MLLGFKRQFAPFVEEGSKTHTIRSERKISPKVGEICHCYVNPRQKTMRLLGRFECIRVDEIKIEESIRQSIPLVVRINGVKLAPDEADALFYRDGFRDLTGETYQHMHQAAEFWKHRLPFEGQMIHWRYTKKGSG